MMMMMSAHETWGADEAAFNNIVQSHYDTLMRTAIRITRHQQSAEDIVQETFLRLWQNRNKILPCNMGGWLYTVTTHLAYQHIKKTKRNSIYVKLSAAQQDWHTDVEDQLLEKENQNTHDTAYMLLPERQQAVYRLSREQGLSRDEIACRLSISPNTVKNHLLKAVQFMKEHIQTVGLMMVLFIFHQLFFNSDSTKLPWRDLYNIADKVNRKSQMEEVYLKQTQHGVYFKNSESLSQIQ
jgi:RNA polymerase sigma-70 factor (family 1)